MIVDMLINKKRNPMVTELSNTVGELNVFDVFITPAYFALPENI